MSVPVIADSTCSGAYGSDFDSSAMVCAGNGAADTCSGDSGGPLEAALQGGGDHLSIADDTAIRFGDDLHLMFYDDLVADPEAFYQEATHGPRTVLIKTHDSPRDAMILDLPLAFRRVEREVRRGDRAPIHQLRRATDSHQSAPRVLPNQRSQPRLAEIPRRRPGGIWTSSSIRRT